MSSLVGDLMNRLRGRLTCAETLELLQQYLDGELSAEEARQVARHLDSCTMCETESEIYREIKLAISLSATETDPEVIARLEAFGERVRNGDLAE
ncbi:MAG: zf-HC2 domain-containing protein [Acidimicrobiales bacterium]|nr:zf-HC2 domain-containing protein [Acidimicrobiales bacterium]